MSISRSRRTTTTLSRGVALGVLTLVLALGLTACKRKVASSAGEAMNGWLAETLFADVVALDQVVTYNRWGAYQPAGMMYALRRDVVDLAGNPIGANGGVPGQVMLRPDLRPRPLVLRANIGDTLEIRFTNLLSPARTNAASTATRLASMLPNGTTLLGDTTDPVVTGIQGISPGQSTTYRWKAEREGTKLFYSNGAPGGGEGEGGQLALGLFGAFNTEPVGSLWYRSRVTAAKMADARASATAPTFIDYNAVDAQGVPILRVVDDGYEIISGDLDVIVMQEEPGDEVMSTSEGTFREFTVIFHDEIGAVQAYSLLTEKVMKGVSDSFGINYGVEALGPRIVANRIGVGPAANCIECAYEEFFLESHANGDPALLVAYEDDPSNVHHSYLNDDVKFRNIHAGPRETHIFHLHAHQWLANSGELTDDGSTYLDSQTLTPMANFTYEMQYGGSGNRNRTPGDAIFHCHLYPHFAQGMWELWRIHDVFEDGTRRLPDGVHGLGTDPITGVTVGGTPIPALVPMMKLAMAPQPTYGAGGLPGFPFYIAGVAGHRPPQAPMDIATDGGLPRHVFQDGGARDHAADPSTGDFHSHVTVANLQLIADEGTPLEQAAMAFHALASVSSVTPEGVSAAFALNGLAPVPGAPYGDPCEPSGVSATRSYHVSFIQLDMLANAAGWHDPQARINVLDSDVAQYEGQTTTANPFFFRANSGECINFYHTNRAPKELDLDDFQFLTPTDTIGQHIHLVKFDVTSSDGSGNGWNYEDGTFARDAIAEWIDASNAVGGTAASGYAADGSPLNLGFDGTSAGGPTVLAASGDFQTTVQRWWADPLLNKLGNDRTIRTVFTHDHFAPSSIQQHGFYNALTVEPAGSQWLTADGTDDLSFPLDPARGVGTQLQIVNADDPATHPDHREFAMFVADLALLYTPAGVPVGAPAAPEVISVGGGTDIVSYRGEPLANRLGTNSDVFSSWAGGDPFTEIFKAYEGDRVQVRVMQGAQTAQHSVTMHGQLWPEDPAVPNSPLIQAYPIGISEHHELELGVMPAVPGGGVADYLYHFGATKWIKDGSWGLMRVFSQGLSFDSTEAQLQAAQLAAQAAGERSVCPTGSPLVSFDVEAWEAATLLPSGAITYNARDGVFDPNARFFILAADRAAYQAGTQDPEPLVMRVNAGDCVSLTLHNHTPDPVSMHQQRLAQDVRYSDGANVGLNFDQMAQPGLSVHYTWYAGADRGNGMQPIELGPSNLRSYGDITADADLGLIGALIVEPAGAVYTDPDTGAALSSGTVAQITRSDGSSYKEFVVLYQEELDLWDASGPIPDAKVDKFEKAVNYRAESFYTRLGVPTSTDLNDVLFPADFMLGPIETPLFRATDGEEVVFQVLVPSGGPFQHSFMVHGHDYPSNGVAGYRSGGATILTPFAARTLRPYGGAKRGTWIYRDGNMFTTAQGFWGRFEVN